MSTATTDVVAGTREVSFSFMTTGPSLRLRLPGEFDPLPKLTSPLFIHGFDRARAFYFIPAAQDTGMSGYLLVKTELDRDGRRVEIYERPEPPPQWWLRWSLRKGFLYSFLKEEDGVDRAATVVAALGVAENTPSGTPFLLPDPPLRVAVAPLIGYGEHATFRSDSGDRAVSVRRPGFLAEGKVMVLHDGDLAFLRAGARLGCEITTSVGKDLDRGRSTLDLLLQSLKEG